jgi:hypothetical protein
VYDQAVTMSFKTTDGTATKNDSDYVSCFLLPFVVNCEEIFVLG